MRLVLPLNDHELCCQKPLKLFWKPLLEIFHFDSKRNEFILNLLHLYQSLFYSWNQIMICGSHSWNCPLRKWILWNYQFGELNVGKKWSVFLKFEPSSLPVTIIKEYRNNCCATWNSFLTVSVSFDINHVLACTEIWGKQLQ